MNESLKVLGPALMRPTAHSMGFWLAFGPGKFENMKVEIKIEGSNKAIRFQRLKDSIYNVYTAIVDDLSSGTKYQYQISINDMPLSTVAGEGYRFRTLSGVENSSRFALISCHGVDAWDERIAKNKAPAGTTFNMWRILADRVESGDVDFAIFAGDQVYMDKDFEGKLGEANPESIYDVYYRFWHDPAYQKVISRIPSFLMWDDHDLLDGFGSRNEQFDKEGNEKGNYSDYRKKLTQAFFEMQAVRNPGDIEFDSKKVQNLSTSIEVNGDHFHIMDLRSERNSFKGALMGKEAWTKLQSNVSGAKNEKRHFFVSPVTFFRMDEHTEGNIAEFANYLWNTLRWIELLPDMCFKYKHFVKSIVWISFFATLFVSTQVPSMAGSHFGSAIVLLLLALFFLVSEVFRNNRKNSKSIHRLMLTAGGLIAGLVSLVIILDLVSDSSWSSMGDYLLGFSKVMPKVFVDNWEVLASAFSLVCFGYVVSLLKKSEKTTVRVIFLAIPAIATVTTISWTGFPDKDPQWGHIINTIALLLGLFYLVVAFLESLNTFEEAAGIDDDVKDGWSSDVNKGELYKFLKLILDNKGKIIPYILSGDIHTGGLSVVAAKSTEEVVRIPQIVSSPITYEPMNHRVEMLTTTKEIREPQTNRLWMEAFNVFYRSERNFAIIDCKPKNGGVGVEYYFEDMVNKGISPLGCQCGPKGEVALEVIQN